jgi:hypothetical protein
VDAANGLSELADRLYALPPADFIAARDEAVKAERDAGDRSRAAEIAKLRRPTVAAWMVNLVALRRPGLLAGLLDLGAELRSAQTQLRGPDLRELATRRRTAIAAIIAEASDLATQAGASRSGLPVGDVETTLIAALADDDIAAVIRAGRLLKPGHYDGFGATPGPQLQVIPGGREDPPAPSARPERVGRRQPPRAEAARARLDEATAALADADSAAATASGAVEAQTHAVTDIEERLTQLRRDRVAAHAALRDAQTTLDNAQAARAAAERNLTAARRATARSR